MSLFNVPPTRVRPARKEDETPEFVQFWSRWQRVQSDYEARASVRDDFFRHVWWKGADPKDIVDGVEYYVRNFKRDQLRMKAETWLDRGFHEDLAERERAYQARLAEREAQRQSERDNVVPMGRPRGQTKFLQEFYAQKAAGE